MSIENEYVRKTACKDIKDLTEASCSTGSLVNHVVLKGSVECMKEDVDFQNYISLSYPSVLGMGQIKFNVIAKKEDDLQELYSRVLELIIPGEVAEIFDPIDTDEENYAKSKLNLTVDCLPFASIGLGKVKDTGEEAAVLFFANGVTPQDALAEVKQAVSDHKIKPYWPEQWEAIRGLPKLRAIDTSIGGYEIHLDMNEYLGIEPANEIIGHPENN